jgi:hypothetical protein
MSKLRNFSLGFFAAIAAATVICAPAAAQQQKPNILIIWGDDIGTFNVSAFNHGMMGYKTPSIDSIAQQGAMFPTGMVSRAAPPAVRPSSRGSRRSAPASPRSAYRAHRKV